MKILRYPCIVLLLFTSLACRSLLPSEQDHDRDRSQLASEAPTEAGPGEKRQFFNPIIGGGADPWVVYKDGYYYYCSANGKSAIWVVKAKSLLEIGKVPGVRVWNAPEGTDHSAQHWASELHFLDGKWYIYYAASKGNNDSHRMFVLESETDDAQGPYRFKGKIAAETDRWAIDGTVMEREGKRYFVWSGWDDVRNIQQNLYLAEMDTPWSLKRSEEKFQVFEAEAARIQRAKVRNEGNASQGKIVGGIDYEDSEVSFDLDAPRSGEFQLDIRFTNGMGSVSKHKLSVNGKEFGEVSYPSMGWNNPQTAHAFVQLEKGRNSISFRKGQGFAELDRLRVGPKGGDRIVISMPVEEFEKRGGPAYINEGPQILERGSKTHIIYSASASWTDEYNLAQLTFEGGDILNPQNWKKLGSKFAKTDKVFGPGHASFTKSPDGLEDWIVYHAARQKGSGWSRDVRTQRFSWDAENNPVFGTPIPKDVPIDVPSGS